MEFHASGADGCSRPGTLLRVGRLLVGPRWDEAQQSPWYAYPDGGAFVQGWYNNPRSWRARLDWIRQEKLGGIGIWVLDGVNDPPERWEALREFTGAAG